LGDADMQKEEKMLDFNIGSVIQITGVRVRIIVIGVKINWYIKRQYFILVLRRKEKTRRNVAMIPELLITHKGIL